MANKKIKHPCDGCEKDKKHCKKCEHANAKALSLADAERMQRQVRTEILSGDLPYNRDVYILQAKFHLRRSAEDILMAGKILLMVREKEPRGEFRRIVEDELGIPHTTAYRLMNTAVKAERHPSIDLSQIGTLSNVYALLEAPDEDLKELETKGVLAGNDMDDLQRMSVKEMRDLIKELKADRESITKGIEKEMRAEKKALENEIKRLSAFEPKDADQSIVDIFSAVDTHLDDIDKLLRNFVVIDAQELQDATISKIQGIYKRITDRLELWEDNWAQQVAGD